MSRGWAAEAADPRVLDDRTVAELLRGAPWRRVVAVGDSVAAGTREPVDGFRDVSWIDRVVDGLRVVRGGDVSYVGLGVVGATAREVRAGQLAQALAWAPDLAVVVAGANDLFRGQFDAGAVEREVDVVVRALRRAGAEVVTTDLVDISRAPFVPAERKARFHAGLRAVDDVARRVSRRHGGLHVDLRDHPMAADPSIWAGDRIHLNARGHAIVGSEAIRRLGDRLRVRAVAA
ncbi:SGNH/GDSL hydrolase family protein [Conexibacter sp. SYSU D00693]|uniref:SGNH/GDSL hydrolase family protein n=1 Tax=Conexibacter sp. SYSU D00693 TaxID=2812560 RepID=UPI00196B9433|nr:SGNH/GDSL hydrolase family protein [Conexibacter sp. SYSU D00693]